MTSNEVTKSFMEIGGYFGLDLPDIGDLYPEVIKLQSARAAIRAVLECNGINRVFIPNYICSSIIKSAIDAGVKVDTYDLDEFLFPKNLPSLLPDQCVLIYVNYFGLCQHNITKLLNNISADKLIIDNSHALFSKATDALATIYSPRKFVGLPDGGLLKASPLLRIVPPLVEDVGSFERMRYLLTRMAYSAREGYMDFEKARISLADSSPLTMSRLTQRLMKSIGWDQVAESRRVNYSRLALMLDSINDRKWICGLTDVPLCYPLTLSGCDMSKIKAKLVELNVFTATYWLDALPRVEENTIEDVRINNTLYLPIDQRMDTEQIERLGQLVLGLTGN